MIRLYWIIGICLCQVFPAARAEQLLLLNWEEYLAPEVVQAFNKEFGHQIRSVIYDSDEERDEILLSPSGKDFDLVVIDNLSSQLLGQKRLQPINKESVPSLRHIAPRWKKSCGEFAVPYFWGTLGIVYRSDILKNAPNSWRDLLNPDDDLKGHIGMMLDYTDTLTPALRVAGHSINTDNITALKDAYKILLKQKPHVLTNRYAISFQQESSDKNNLYLALAYSGDEYGLNTEFENDPWKFVMPKEGTALWVDCFAVIQGSKHKAAALEFINFINRPDIAALNATQLGNTTVNLSAEKILNDNNANKVRLYPSQRIIQGSMEYTPISDANLRQRNRIIRAIAR